MKNNFDIDIYEWFFMALLYQNNPKEGIPLHDIFTYQIHLVNMSGSCEPGNYEPFKYSLLNLKKLDLVIEKEGKLYLSDLFDDMVPFMELMENEENLYNKELFAKTFEKLYAKTQETICENHNNHGIANYKNGSTDITEDIYNKAWADYATLYGHEL